MLYDKIKIDADEQILIQTRRHWFVIVAQLAGFFIAGFFPIVFLTLMQILPTSPFFDVADPSYIPYLSYAYGVWLIFLWIGAFGAWTNHYLDILVVTNRRVILINQKGYFKRNTGSFRLERMQDMNVEINGIIPTLLDFGSLTVETAGHGEEKFQTYGLPHPRELRTIIMQAADELLDRHIDPTPLKTDGL